MNKHLTLLAITIIVFSLLLIPEALATGSNQFSAPVPTGANANSLKSFMQGIQGLLEHNIAPIVIVVLGIWAGISYAAGNQEMAYNVGIGMVISIVILVAYGAMKDQLAAAGGGMDTKTYIEQSVHSLKNNP